MFNPEDLWESQPGDYFFISTKSKTGRWKDYVINRGEWEQVDFLLEQFKDRNLYMCPHGFSAPSREKSVSVDPHLLYADLDEADPRTFTLRPTIAIESSPGRFVGYWLTDGPVTEQLNRRLAYHIGADKSGWDRTQVLRIPGTRNYKYEPAARVKLLWKDGPTYRVDRLEKMLPQTPESAENGSADADHEALQVYKAYEKSLSRWARKELLEGNPRTGRRSEVLWKLQNELLEKGASTDEVFVLLRASPWNKFRDRRGGDEQLRREIQKNLSRRVAGDKAAEAEAKSDTWNPLPRSLAQVERTNVDWIIPGFLARKELTILEGDPAAGKSYLCQVISGCICDGKSVPLFPSHTMKPGRVVYFDTENTAGTVTKARIEDNKVEHLENFFQGEDPFSIDDEERWELVMDRLIELRPSLVVFDTINTYIGGSDTYRASEVQQAMGYFKRIALELDCPVVLIRHLTKGGKEKAIYRGQGSIAFTGAARIVATVGRWGGEDDKARVVTCTKNNLGAYFKSFTYSIEGLGDRGGHTGRSRLVWGEHVDATADEVFSDEKKEKNEAAGTRELDKAKELIESQLDEHGRIEVNGLLKLAGQKTIDRKTIRKAIDLMELRVDLVNGVQWISRK